VQFTAAQTIPASGRIVITPQVNVFTIPAGLDFNDIDLAVSSGGPYVDRDLAASADATNDGVSVVSGTTGSITITLNSTSGITAGQLVRVTIGTSATFGATGTNNITDPDSNASYQMVITTRDAGNTLMDRGAAMIAIVDPVGISTVVVPQAAVLSNGLPSGLLAAGNTTIELSFNADRPSTCRYATSSNVLYSDMTGKFNRITPFFFTKVLGGFQNNTSYNFYIRCLTDNGITNTSDFIISFSLDVDPISNSSIPSATSSQGRGGVGDYLNGSPVLYTAAVTMEGWASPGSTVTLLRDGKIAVTTQAKSDGSFSGTIANIERGTYTFQTYFEDSHGVRSGSYTQTLALGAGSDNILSNIVIPPIAILSSTSIALGDPVTVYGESILNGTIELSVMQQGKAGSPTAIQTFSATTSDSGAWQIIIPGSKFQKGSYTIRARVTLNPQARSEFGKLLFLGVGQNPNPDLSNRADINKDGKVNLIDFSILLSHWKTADADSDINQDGDVNLADFSILLFNWTG
jgi:hypothetical protein